MLRLGARYGALKSFPRGGPGAVPRITVSNMDRLHGVLGCATLFSPAQNPDPDPEMPPTFPARRPLCMHARAIRVQLPWNLPHTFYVVMQPHTFLRISYG